MDIQGLTQEGHRCKFRVRPSRETGIEITVPDGQVYFLLRKEVISAVESFSKEEPVLEGYENYPDCPHTGYENKRFCGDCGQLLR